MADPVIVSSGQTYERRCIIAWMDLGQSMCVMQSIPLERDLIIPNVGLKAAILKEAKKRGMSTLPSPPTPEYAYVLATRLIQELRCSNSGVQEQWYPESESEDGSGYYDEKTDVLSGPIRIENFRSEADSEEAEQEEGAQDDNLSGRFEGSGIDDGSGYSHPLDAHTEASISAHERKGIHLKSSSSLPPMDTVSMEDIDVRGGKFATGPSRLKPADAHQAAYARAAANLEQDFEYFRAASSMKPSRVSRRTAGEVRQSPGGSHELPPHLLTKPSSYSSPEPSVSSSSAPSTADPLLQRLRSENKEEQEAAVVELRQLSRIPENRIPLCRTDIIEALLPLFKSKDPNVQVNAVASLVNLSIEKPNKVGIVRAGAVRFLVEVLYNGCSEAQEHAAGAAFSLAIADENKHPMGVLNAIPPLMQLLHTGPNGARQDAAMALYHLSLLQTNKTKLVKVGAVPILLNLAQSRERPDLASRALIILSNVASIPEGRAALLQLNTIPVLVRLLAMQGGKSAASIPEQAAAVLVLLAKNYVRFKSVAQSAGAQEVLTVLAETGTVRAREKALALLAMMKESSSGSDELDAESVISRQYMRMRVDGGQMNSSAF